MKPSDEYFKNIQNMLAIKKTDISQKQLKEYYKYGEESLKNLKYAVKEMLSWGDEIAPSIPPRDDLPDMYMRFGHWEDAKRVMEECYKHLALNKEQLDENIKWIEECQKSTSSVLNHLEEFPGVLQKDMYKRLYELDKDALKWTLRFYNGISKIKDKNTNKLYIKGKEPKNLPLEKEENIELVKKAKITRNVDFPNWYIMISFGKSTSSNYLKALTLAKNALIYQEQEDGGNITHSAVYGKSKNEYLAFIQLYETVSNWKSTFVIINGDIVDRKIVGQINYCYGDKCRSGKVDFCYGASMFTDNPFGCHRLQISRYNNPWWSFYRKVDIDYILDKVELVKRVDSVADTYNYCPDFNLDKIKQVIKQLPLRIKNKEYLKLIDENQNYGNELINLSNNASMTIKTSKSKAKEYYEEDLNKNEDSKSIVKKLFSFLKKG